MKQYRTVLGLALAGAALAGFSMVLARYRKELRAARERLIHLGSQVIETECGPTEFASMGEGFPVLMVHGAIGGFDQGLFLARNLDMSRHQVISVSRFGYLRSPIPAGATLDMQADAFACLLDALNIRQAVVFAVSAGSTSAIRFAARHPERVSALILFSPDVPGDNPLVQPPRFVFDRLFRSDFLYWVLVTYFEKSLRKAFGLIPPGHHPTPADIALVRNVLRGDLPASPRMDGTVFESYTIFADYMASVSPDSPYPLKNIRTPALIIHAVNDPIIGFEGVRRLAGQMPNARLYAVPDGGHLFFGHAREVQAEIAEFLRANEPELQNA